jgi:hypothetical protein
MFKSIIKQTTHLIFLLIPLVAPLQAQDFPHSFAGNGISCFDCHDIHTSTDKLLKVINPRPPETIEDTPANNLCWSCHNDVIAPFMRTHSSISIDNGYGDWAMECRTCHNPHFHPQQKYSGPDAYLTQATISSISADTLTSTGAGWTPDEFAGLILFADITRSELSYRILSNTADTITAEMDISTAITNGLTFGVGYGKLIHQTINAPDRENCSVVDNVFTCTNTFPRPVKFYRSTGDNSFADPDDTETDGPCQVCHSRTTHFRFDGTGPDQWHMNVKGGTAGLKCTEVCHKHENGFAHGGAGVSGGKATTCIQCHGHEKGTRYDPDAAYPYTDPGEGGLTSYGAGTTTPHSTHTESWSTIYPPEAHEDDKRGPAIYCDVCHDTNSMPTFKSGTDLDGNGIITLSETNVCNSCHSPEGTYNGVNSTNDSVGAKDNWNKQGVYQEDGTLNPDKGKWCAGCHDENPAVIANWGSVSAPNIVGDEDGDYTYGVGWGFYKTGHGLPSDQSPPSSGGAKSGPGKQCHNCHDTTLPHIDGDHRTFDCTDGCDPDEHQAGYRLRRINDQAPMTIPFMFPTDGSNVSADDFLLCFSCHNNEPFLTTKKDKTNYITMGVNRHFFHLSRVSQRYLPASADYSNESGSGSRPTCLTCHNVHGSTNLAMIRDGKLVDLEPGFRIWYSIYPNTSGQDTLDPPEPADLPLTASNGTTWAGSEMMCNGGCHGIGQTYNTYRASTFDPFYNGPIQIPRLLWSDQVGYITDGANPDMASAGSLFTFQIDYLDTNNSAPTSIEVWVDLDDNGSYEANEKFAMDASYIFDFSYYDGKQYEKRLTLTSSGDNLLNYRFYASDGADPAIDVGTNNSTLQLLNAVPTLAWTTQEHFVADGINPNLGGSGASYEFRVNYTDLDAVCPTADNIQVWIDTDDSSSYASNEKFNLSAVDSGDTNCADGKLYSLSKNINFAGDGNLNYRFYATDGTDTATGNPINEWPFTVNNSGNNPPILEFVAGSCRTDAVSPRIGASGADFTFTVNYTDGDNQCPTSGNIQLWLDHNDSGIYGAGEKHNLTEVDSGDTNCADGKLYQTTRVVNHSGDDTFNYYFFANDGLEDAIGEATSVHQVTALNASKVRPGGGLLWYSSIQSAINAANNERTIVVYDGTYNEDLNLDGTNDNYTTLQSACGADSTIISGSTNVVEFQWLNTGSTIDGFQITGGTHGIYINNASPTIKNSKIHGNDATGGQGGGIYNNSATSLITLDNVEVYNNHADHGGGIFLNSGRATITDTTIRDNTATNGAGLYVQNQTTGVTLTNTTIKNNNSTELAGGIYFNNGSATLSRCTIIDNSAGTLGGAWYANDTGSSPYFENCIIANNSASMGGGFFLNDAFSTVINSSLIANNATSADTGGGAIYVQNSSAAIIRNSLLWDNTAAESGYIGYMNGGVITITNSIMNNDGDGLFTDAPYFDANADEIPSITSTASEIKPSFTDTTSSDYHLIYPTEAIDSASAAYAPENDRDNIARPQGSADDIGAYEVVTAGTNFAPTLSWTGESQYISDAVDPAWGYSSSEFTFRVDFSDPNNTLPSAIEVWIDTNSDSAYTADEKLSMSETDGADTSTSDGKRYTLTTAVTASPAEFFKSYRIYASDSQYDATGSPTQLNKIALVNNVPALKWTGEPDYLNEGVNPDSANAGSLFTFRVDYSDIDNALPTQVAVWIDTDDSGTIDFGEEYLMSETDSADSDVTDGKRYTLTINVPFVADGSVSYLFSATDGSDPATGLPVDEIKTLNVNEVIYPLDNNQPMLSWSAGICRTDGVRPPLGASNTDFEFLVNYTDLDNQCAGTIQVWVDSNENGHYDSDEKHTLTAVDSADNNCSDGKQYHKTDLNLFAADNSLLNYRFYADDGIQPAAGIASIGGTVNVIEAQRVRPGGGTDWESDINVAVNKLSGSTTTLVYPNTNYTVATYSPVSFTAYTNIRPPYTSRVIQSVCGADLTKISGGSFPIQIIGADGATLDGFSITGGSFGGLLLDGGNGNFYVRNNKFYDNVIGVYQAPGSYGLYNDPIKYENNEFYNNTNRAIFAVGPYALEVSDSLFYNNNSIENSFYIDSAAAGNGGAIYANTRLAIIKRSTFRNNTSVADGGAIYYIGNEFSIENSLFSGNQALNGGAIHAAVYTYGRSGLITNSTFTNNSATNNGGALQICKYTPLIAVRNSIFWNNSAGVSGDTAYGGISTTFGDCNDFATDFITITDSNVDTSGNHFSNGTPVIGNNINADPAFVNPGADDFHIQAGSPMVDQGNATYAPIDDIDGEARPMGAGFDIGADEAN